MEHIVFLVHRIPYPPNKGDKIRSYHLLKELCRHYHVHLGCFVDDPLDWQHAQHLDELCYETLLLPLKAPTAYLRGLSSFITNRPITVPFYHSATLRKWVASRLTQHAITRAMVFSSSMAQYFEGPHFQNIRRIIDFVDVDSHKWSQYSDKQKGLLKWVYKREHQALRHYEQKISAEFDLSLFVSAEEAAFYKSRIPTGLHDRVGFLSNGVDTAFFDPHHPFEHNTAPPYIVFTGAMDYWANIDAVAWFCEQVWPGLRRDHPNLRFYIVGGNPSRQVRELPERYPGVQVTGRVADVRPYIAAAELVVAPLRIARGIQNKVLEAMAMGKAVVSTSMAMEGIDAGSALKIQIADEPQPFQAACQRMLVAGGASIVAENREWVLERYSWQHTLRELPRMVGGGTG